MQPNDDSAQLKDFVAYGSQDAFATLVRRYLRLVYGAALRRLNNDAHLAEDVTQMAFVALARNASALSKHPDLPGWLFTTTRYLAAKAARREFRRSHRENIAMNSPINLACDGDTNPRLNAVLDDAIAELRQLDREIILLRFHGGLQLADIGARLGISENAVQKRVTRALDDLKDKLAKKGVTSTAMALAAAFEAQTAIAVPAGVASAAMSASGMAGTALGASALISLSKVQLALAGAAILAGTGGLTWQIRENGRLRDALSHQTESVHAAEKRLKSELNIVSQRATEAEADNKRLRVALQATTSRPSVRTSATDPRADFRALMARANALNRDGLPQEALNTYLTAYRNLAGKRGAANVDRQILATGIRGLSRTYPPALPALRQLRDEALERASQNPDDKDSIAEFAELNERLGDGKASISLYDSLPDGHPGRQTLATIARSTLIESKRYKDAIEGTSFGAMMSEFEMATRDPNSKGEARAFAIRSTVANIEVLTGAGRPAEANTLTSKLLAFDSSETTRAAIREHVERASQSEKGR